MLRRWAVLASALTLTAAASPALADDEDSFIGRAVCGSSGGLGCEVSAEFEEGAPDTPGAGNTGDPSGDGAAPTEPACEVEGLRAQCSATTPGGSTDDSVDFEALAYAAHEAFQLPTPSISMSPSADVPLLVHVPVWMWIDSGEWSVQEATATVPGGSVTVTATPVSSSWSMGDGVTVDCDGPGTAYDADEYDAAAESPDCGHTYTTASGSYDLNAAVSWDVEWSSSDGGSGVFPALETRTSTTVEVIESSAVVT